MGYPMTYDRVLNRNHLLGNYTHSWDANRVMIDAWFEKQTNDCIKMMSGDLRRLENDAVDGGWYTQQIAQESNTDIDTVQRVLRAFFKDAPRWPPHDEL